MLATCGWTLLALVGLDVAVNLAFPMPASNKVPPSELARYFDYGRSIEGKLAYLVGSSAEHEAPIVSAGWIGRECSKVPEPVPPGQTGVTVYGMSFSYNIAQAMLRIDPSLRVSSYGGPGAPPNHSYACFRSVQAAGRDPNPTQVVGILASSLDRMLTVSGLSTSFEGPMPFAYPRFHLGEDGRLTAEQPVLQASEELRDEAKFGRFKQQMASSDAFYDRWQFDALLDQSAFVRLVRRGYAQARHRATTERLVRDEHGYIGNPDIGPPLIAMLSDFARRARASGQKPLVILIQDRTSGPPDELYRLLAPGLEQAGVPFVSTHETAPPTDSANFIADGHFTEEADGRTAERVLQALGLR